MTYERIEHDRQRFYHVPELNKDLPSSTTILKILDKPALLFWAVNKTIEYIREKGKDGNLSPNEILYGARGAHEVAKTEAADIGTRVHDLIAQFHTIELQRPDIHMEHGEALSVIESLMRQGSGEDMRVKACLDTFLKWRDQTRFTVKETEKTVYSEKYEYAGTLDAIGYVNGNYSVVDYKSSNGIWPEYHLQVVSYLMAYQEMTKEKPTQAWIVRFGKDGSFDAKRVKSVRDVMKGFVAATKLWRAMEMLKAEAKLTTLKR